MPHLAFCRSKGEISLRAFIGITEITDLIHEGEKWI